MRTPRPKLTRALMLSAMCLLLFAPPLAAAQDHVVSTADLRSATVAQAQARKDNLSKVEKFFSSPRVRKAAESAHLDPVRIQKAIPTLSDAELARLASRTDKVQQDFAAGALTNQQITYILIALATAVVVIIAT